ncbi:hypothetical protein CVM73_22655 [Bradyrhizobium forestalis]|uniref:Uncharacterized protein n=1 Tax=Bradyrhizobium forestalis TaxID=1419263 RepID=A0A2M8R523_9BRAD|nr:hypothetical protein CVM73_22655 [Bradyrhizobium forestalis]
MTASVWDERSQPRHCEELLRRSNPESLRGKILDCFAEPVIGPRFARTRWLAMTNVQAARPTGRTIPRRSWSRSHNVPARAVGCRRGLRTGGSRR